MIWSLINTLVMSPSRLHQASFPSYGNRVEECFSNLSLTPKSFGYLVESVRQTASLPKATMFSTLSGNIPQSLCEWALCTCPLCNQRGL